MVAEERESARRLTQHLIDLGHRRIGLIGSDPENRCVMERCEGISDVLLKSGICSDSPPRVEVPCRNVRWTLPDWKEIVKDWFSGQNPPTALITINDTIALQLYPVLHQRGLSIPHDVSVVSFGDKVWSAHLEPPLTTSRADDKEVARLAFLTLMKCIENPLIPSVRIEVPQKFIIRESSGPPPQQDLLQGIIATGTTRIVGFCKEKKGNSMSESPCTMHLVANMHWDREWHFTVEQTRPMLKEKFTAILNILESDPEFKSFLLDGQSVILDDYMEVCPEERERIIRLVRDERLFVGPWYSLPDEYIVSGESIIRNIFMGHKVSEEFGGVMKVAYTPCSYGQISQMPQIWRGFGIDAALFYRGVRNDLTDRLFRWEGADGSQIYVYRFGPTGRTDFFWEVLRPAVYDKYLDRTIRWGQPGMLFHLCDEETFRNDYFLLDPPHILYRDERIAQGMERLREIHFKDSPIREHLLFMVGSDCTAPHPRLSEIVVEANRHFKDNSMNLYISSLPAFVQGVQKTIRLEDLKTSLKGEIHEAVKVSGSGLLESVISSRIYLKQANEATEVAIQSWAEPTAAIAWQLGQRYPERFLERAWKTLLACHPHDSVCGVSIDDVSDDMIYRFRQARQCAWGVAQDSLRTIIKDIDLSDAAETIFS